jgi:hypothetical protein
MLCLIISTITVITEDSTHKRFLTSSRLILLFAGWKEKKFTISGILKAGTISIAQRNQAG